MISNGDDECNIQSMEESDVYKANDNDDDYGDTSHTVAYAKEFPPTVMMI